MANEDYDVLTLKEVSLILRVHPTMLNRLAKKGNIPSFRIGSRWRFRTDLLESWMAEQMLRNLRALPARRKPMPRRQRGRDEMMPRAR
jgi:excisionase family DNA binding protein